MRLFATVLILVCLTAPLRADEIVDALTAAQTAYGANDVKEAAAQVALAQAGLRARQNALLEAFLPEAPAGFTREIVADYAAGFGMFGGGAGAEARYSNADGSFTVDLIADNEMVVSMLGMFADTTTMAMMGTVIKVGAFSILDQEQNLTALVGNRVMVSATGMDSALMLPTVQAIDFEGLAEFDKQS